MFAIINKQFYVDEIFIHILEEEKLAKFLNLDQIFYDVCGNSYTILNF